MDLYQSEAYKASIELNNIGVELLKRFARHEALHVFRDSISVMCSVLKDGSMPPPTHILLGKIGAAKRILSTIPEDFSYDRIFVATLEDLAGGWVHCENHIGVGITIEPNAEDDRNSDLESSVILQNFGLSHYLLASEQTGEKREQLLSTALSICEYALDVHKAALESDFMNLLTIQTRSIVFYCKICILDALGYNNEARATVKRVRALRQTFRSMNADLMLMRGSVTAPAA